MSQRDRPNGIFIDLATQEYDMHVCPRGYAMAGLHADNDFLLCIRVTPAGEESCVVDLLDPSTQRANMHACPARMYMRGLDLDRNVLLCGANSLEDRSRSREYEDLGSQGFGMHVCQQEAGRYDYMTGIHADQNRF